jgi:hypothetical protein
MVQVRQFSKGSRVIVKKAILWTPTRDNPAEPNLFRIICYIWTKAKDCTAKMLIRASYDLWSSHVGLEWRKHDLQTFVVELATKFLESQLLPLAPACWEQEVSYDISDNNENGRPFGIGRKATGITPLPCARRAVFEMLPMDV